MRLRRRKAEDSRLPPAAPLDQVYDWIRMVDCVGFPPAFLDYGLFRVSFKNAALRDGRIEAIATITANAAPHA
jgi:methionyl-tRNA formyltransferase